MHFKQFALLASILPAVVAGVIPRAGTAGDDGSAGSNDLDIIIVVDPKLPPQEEFKELITPLLPTLK
ncbi:hypothetical protein PM082_006708 [Marasmius tenuissimus]|nr:hypothetical protein PM082_006708 [Marasmius tenuissimus]